MSSNRLFVTRRGKPTKHIIQVKQLYHGAHWYWRIRARNGEIIQHGQTMKASGIPVSRLVAIRSARAFGDKYNIPVYVQKKGKYERYGKI
jgi:hypothetical protein